MNNRRQAESHPSLLEDGRGAKEEDDSQNCPTLYAVMHNEDKDKVYEIELGKNHPDEDLWN